MYVCSIKGVFRWFPGFRPRHVRSIARRAAVHDLRGDEEPIQPVPEPAH